MFGKLVILGLFLVLLAASATYFFDADGADTTEAGQQPGIEATVETPPDEEPAPEEEPEP